MKTAKEFRDNIPAARAAMCEGAPRETRRMAKRLLADGNHSLDRFQVGQLVEARRPGGLTDRGQYVDTTGRYARLLQEQNGHPRLLVVLDKDLRALAAKS